MTAMDASLVIFFCQIVCCALLVAMYVPQIIKIGHRHSVADISLEYNYIKILLTVVSILVLNLTDNSLMVVMAQYVSLALGGVVLVQIIYYMHKSGDTKPIHVMYAVVTSFIALMAVILIIVDSSSLIVWMLQLGSFVVMFAQYIPQVTKIAKRKSVGDISIAHWICKLVYSVLALMVLVLSHNSLVVALTQVFNFIFTAIITWQCMKYREKA